MRLRLFIVILLLGLVVSRASAAPLTLHLYSPSSYQVFQRQDGSGAIRITGDVQPPGNYLIEARWGDNPWTAIASNVRFTFEGMLANQTQGQADLQVRIGGTETVVTAKYVGIGDIFLIAGQSNAMGYGLYNQVYSHPSLKAGLFANDYLWKELKDPTDLYVGSVDPVSLDTLARGSIWPLLATAIMADQQVPVAFIPTAKGSSSIFEWLPTDKANRKTLYGAMLNRALWVGNIKAVLWWQGETEAHSFTAARTYADALEQLADGLWNDLGAPLIPAKLQAITYAKPYATLAINDGIHLAVDEHDHILPGPDLGDLVVDDSAHLRTNAKLAEAASRWWAALKADLYP